LTRLSDALRVDRTALRPAAATKASLGVIAPLIAGIIAGQPAAGAAAAFGALSVGITVITAGPRTPFGTLLATSAGMGVATFAGSLTGLVPPLHLAFLAAAGFIAGLLVAAGRGATQVGVNAMIALLVFGRHAAGPDLAAVHASWVVAGGLIQTALAVALRWPRPLRAQREALAAGYEALANTATQQQPPIAVAEAAVTAKDALAPLLSTDRSTAVPLRGLADQLDRIRQEFHALHFQRAEQFSRSGAASLREEAALIDASLALMAQALAEIAAALRQRRVPAGVDAAADRLLEIADQLGNRDPARQPEWPTVRFASARIAALGGQLRAAGRMVAELAGARRIRLPVTAAYAADAIVVLPGQLSSAARAVLAAMSPSSPAFRHGVRLAVVVAAATEISRLLPWPRGYWLPLTAVIVLKPDFTATVSRGVARTVGTAIGLLAAEVLVTVAHPHGVVLVAAIGVCAWLGYCVFAANYAVYSIFLTAIVILLVSAAGASATSTVENRGFDTLIGGAIAILAYLIWPTWEAKALQAATADRYESIRRFLVAALEVYLEPQAFDRAALARLAADTRRSQSAVIASLQRAVGEPARFRPDIARYAGVIAAGRRIVAGAHALASHLHDAKVQVAVPAAAVIAGQIDDAMHELVRALRSGEAAAPLPGLRQSQRQLASASSECATQQQRRGAILAALLDPLVDSIDTAADLLSRVLPRDQAELEPSAIGHQQALACQPAGADRRHPQRRPGA
jgi:uncharacterized membrane protein YccC